MSSVAFSPAPLIERRIYLIRNLKVLLDADLAELYGVSTGALNQAVKRNRERFPEDFMFQLTEDEASDVGVLRSQFVILKEEEESEQLDEGVKTSVPKARGQHSKYLPYAFTEQGVAMLSSVLRSPRAIQVNIAIVRTFVNLRQILTDHHELADRLEQVEKRQAEQGEKVKRVFQVIERLTQSTDAVEIVPKRRIGFPGSAQKRLQA